MYDKLVSISQLFDKWEKSSEGFTWTSEHDSGYSEI